MNEPFDSFEIWDSKREIAEIGAAIYDFESDELQEKVLEHFEYDIIGSDVMIIDRIEILPKFRGKGLAKEVIKDAYYRIGSGCGLIALKAFPLQCERFENDGWRTKMELHLMEKKVSKAKKRLIEYYEDLGFESVVKKDILVLNPASKCNLFD